MTPRVHAPGPASAIAIEDRRLGVGGGPPNERLAAEQKVREAFFIVDVNGAELKTIADRVEKKQVAASVGAVLPLADARVAHEMLARDRPRPRDKIVLTTGLA